MPTGLHDGRVSEARRDVFRFGTFLNGEVDLGEDGFVGDWRNVIFEAALERGFKGFVVQQRFAAEFSEE